MDAHEATTTPARRRWDRASRALMILGAGLPWAVALGLLLAPVLDHHRLPGSWRQAASGLAIGQPGHTRDLPDPEAEAEAEAEVEATGSPRGALTAAPPRPGQHRPGPSSPQTHDAASPVATAVDTHRDVLDQRVQAAAILLARAWLTGLGPGIEGLPVEAPEPLYAEHLTVESVERAGGFALVVVAAVVLDPAPTGHPPRLRRVAVPLVDHPAGPQLAGEPYLLPQALPITATLVSHPIDDGDVVSAIRTALDRAGFEDAELHGVERTASWPVLAHIDHHDRRTAVWLRPTIDGEWRLAGTPVTAQPTDAEEVDAP